MMSRLPLLALPLALALLLAGCDIAAMLADPKVAQREADAKAIGGACRFGMRSIEDCYELNERASKAAVFAGWKDMDQYMRDNKVEGIPAKLDKSAEEPPKESAKEKPSAEPKSKGKASGEKMAEKASDKAAEKNADKAADKPASGH